MYRPRDIASLSIALVAVSFSAIFIRLCVSPPAQIAFYRLIGSGLIFLAYGFITSRSVRIPRHDVQVAALSAVFLAAHFFFWMSALFLTSINSATVLLATQPLFALLIQQLILRISVRPRNLLSLVIGLIGTWIVARGDFSLSPGAGRGDMFAIFSAAMAACYLMTGARRKGALVPYLAVMYSFAGVLLVVVALLKQDALTPKSDSDWLWYALLILGPTLVGHTLLNRAMKQLPSYAVNLSILVEPALTAVLAFIVFGEVITGNVWMGGALILGSLAVEFWPSGAGGPPLPAPGGEAA